MPYGITGLERVKIYQYNPKHLYPKLNGYRDNDQRKVWTSVGSTHCTCQLTILLNAVLECGFILRRSACSRSHIHVYARSSVCKAVVLITEVAVTYLLRVAKMPFVFFHVEYCDIHFVYGFCNGNALAAVEEYRRHFPDRRIPSRRVYSYSPDIGDTGCMLLTYVLPSTLNHETAATPNTS